MRVLSLTLYLSMLACLALRLAGCDRQAADAAVGPCEQSSPVPAAAGTECNDRACELHAVVASVAGEDPELAAWVLEMRRQEAGPDTWGMIKHCLSLDEPERSECLRRAKGDD